MVGQPHIELLQLDIQNPLNVALVLDVQKTLRGRQHVTPTPDLDVDGHRINDGQRSLVLLADDAGEHLGVVEVTGQRPLPERGPEGEDSRAAENHSGALPLAGVGQNNNLDGSK